MTEPDNSPAIPEQHTGVATNTESGRDMGSHTQAREFFRIVRQRLLRPDAWHEFAGVATADFALMDSSGNKVNRDIQKGDYLRIDIPGPGTVAGDGYDWVRVEDVVTTSREDAEETVITVRPATSPSNTKPDVAHFFDSEATSSFRVRREGSRVTAGVYGRNEKPNTGASSTVDKVRNATIAATAVSGLSKVQWKSLVTGLIKD
ncbi:MAG TPA: hypothetical protein VFZ78_12000 [Flavisolibacter sp.]